MKQIKIIVGVFLLSSSTIFAQVGIGTTSPNNAAELDVNSTSKGVLFPRMSNAQMTAISNPSQGLQIYNTDANCMYFYNGQQWVSTLNSISALVNVGDVVQLDNIKIRVASSGNRSMQIATVSGNISTSASTFNLYPSSNVGSTGGAGSETGIGWASTTVGTSFVYVQSAAHFPYYGSVQRFLMIDATNRKSYRFTCIFGNGGNKNTIEIERVY
jgi:hypothetical protein